MLVSCVPSTVYVTSFLVSLLIGACPVIVFWCRCCIWRYVSRLSLLILSLNKDLCFVGRLFFIYFKTRLITALKYMNKGRIRTYLGTLNVPLHLKTGKEAWNSITLSWGLGFIRLFIFLMVWLTFGLRDDLVNL